MPGAFGLHDGYQLPRFPGDRPVKSRTRIDVWMLLRAGGLTQGAVRSSPTARKTQALAAELMTVAEVGRLFRISLRTVGHRVQVGKLPRPITRKPALFLRSQIQDLLRVADSAGRA